MSTPWLISSLCMVACAVGCTPSSPLVRITGKLSSNDVVQIERAVREEMLVVFHSATRRPIKSIEVTTNNSYEIARRALRLVASEAATNPTARIQLHQMEERMQSAAPQPAVAVWYADEGARWGEAGYIVEKGTNGWKVTVRLFR